MNLSDDYRDDMDGFQDLSDAELDRLLAGRLPSGREDLEELAARLGAAREALVRPPQERVVHEHLAAIVEAARVGQPKEAAVGSSTGAARGAGPGSRFPRWRSAMLKTRS